MRATFNIHYEFPQKGCKKETLYFSVQSQLLTHNSYFFSPLKRRVEPHLGRTSWHLQLASRVGAGRSTEISLFWFKLRPFGRGGVWKKDNPGCRVQKGSVLTQKLFFWHAFKGVHRYRIFPSPSQPQAWQTVWILSLLSSLWCKLRPCGRSRLKEG